MDAYFNELSCFPLCKSKECAKERAYKFASLLSETKKQGFNVVRCHDRGMAEILLSQDYSIADFCNENLRGIKEMLLLSLFVLKKNCFSSAIHFLLYKTKFLLPLLLLLISDNLP